MPSHVIVVHNDFAKIADKLHKAATEIVDETAKHVVEHAQEHAAVDTGAMRAGVYAVSRRGSGYAEAAAEATSRNAKDGMQSEEPAPDKDTAAVIHAGMPYSVYLEYGTTRAGAQPFVTPAVEDERSAWESAWGNLESKLK